MNGTRQDTIQKVWDGDPGGYHLNDDRNVLWVKLPTGSLGRLEVQEGTQGTNEPPVWGFEEHEDGTITVTPSIQQHEIEGHAEAWHGFLQRGVWTP
jgi:hypothetical protein